MKNLLSCALMLALLTACLPTTQSLEYVLY